MSVVVPIYNPGALLDTCLGALRRQTYPNLEIVPVDDAGPQPVRAVLEELARVDPRVRPVIHEKNRGLAGALNSGVSQATGTLILVVEQDVELLAPDALDRCVPLLEADPTLCLTGARKLAYGEITAPEAAFTLIRDHLPPEGGPDLEVLPFSELKCDLFPRAALDKVGGFDTSFRFSGEDQMLGYRLSTQGFHIRSAQSLAYVLRTVGMEGVGPNLRREVTYARTQAALLLRTALGSLRDSAKQQEGKRRVSNRGSSVLAAVALGLLPLLWLLGAPTILLVLTLVPAAVRAVWVAARGTRFPRSYARRGKAIFLAGALSPIDDVVYAASLFIGAAAYAVTRRS